MDDRFSIYGLGHILCDITTLNSIVPFQLLPANGATLEERLKMEVALCGLKHFNQVDQLSTLFTTTNTVFPRHSQRLFTCAYWLDRLSVRIQIMN